MSSVDAWVENFRAQETKRIGAGIPWLDALRARAMDRFASAGWPTSREQGWRHTSLALLQQQRFSVHGQDADANAARDLVARLRHDEPGYWLVFVDGVYIEGLSDVGNLPSGVTAMPLSLALASHAEQVQDLFGDEGQGAAPAALNMALSGDGGFISVLRGVALDHPIHLVFITASAGSSSFPRTLIAAESGSRATVVEHYVSTLDDVDAAASLTNAVTRTHVASDANLTHLKLQLESEQTFHLASIHAEQAVHSVWNSHSMSFGARLARNDIATQFNGERCETLLNGLYYVDGRRHVDHNTLIDHAQPNGASREYYRGILADQGRGVFGGRIHVAPGADGTDAIQRSDSLLLSRLARADARPELEIYADDVKCAHGATVGQIDDDAMFYLRTRGLDDVHARNLLTYAFAAETIARIEVPGLRRRVARLIRDRLPGGAALGDIE